MYKKKIYIYKIELLFFFFFINNSVRALDNQAGRKTVRAGRSALRNMRSWNTIIYMKFVFNGAYAYSIKDKVHRFYHPPDGLSDSGHILLTSRDVRDRNLVNLLLKTFLIRMMFLYWISKLVSL